ncbi:MAG TPA: hypothetical protein VGL78_00110 [Solirubrobacteraceae bacterium]
MPPVVSALSAHTPQTERPSAVERGGLHGSSGQEQVVGLELRDGRSGQSGLGTIAPGQTQAIVLTGRTWRFGNHSGDVIHHIAALQHVDRAEASLSAH